MHEFIIKKFRLFLFSFFINLLFNTVLLIENWKNICIHQKIFSQKIAVVFK